MIKYATYGLVVLGVVVLFFHLFNAFSAFAQKDTLRVFYYAGLAVAFTYWLRIWTIAMLKERARGQLVQEDE